MSGQAPITAGTPFSSGQIVAVTVPANGIFNNTSENLVVAECAAPNGVLPPNPAACDSNTFSADTINPNSDGSVLYSNYTIYALPDTLPQGLGESSTSTPVCGNTVATECVLYIGTSPEDFTQPHYFSQPFLAVHDAGDVGSNPGDGTPETPLAVMLPLAGVAVIGGGLALRRRRNRAHAA